MKIIDVYPGGPRLASCGRLKVFNNGTGYCDDPENVKGWSVLG